MIGLHRQTSNVLKAMEANTHFGVEPHLERYNNLLDKMGQEGEKENTGRFRNKVFPADEAMRRKGKVNSNEMEL